MLKTAVFRFNASNMTSRIVSNTSIMRESASRYRVPLPSRSVRTSACWRKTRKWCDTVGCGSPKSLAKSLTWRGHSSNVYRIKIRFGSDNAWQMAACKTVNSSSGRCVIKVPCVDRSIMAHCLLANGAHGGDALQAV